MYILRTDHDGRFDPARFLAADSLPTMTRNSLMNFLTHRGWEWRLRFPKHHTFQYVEPSEQFPPQLPICPCMVAAQTKRALAISPNLGPKGIQAIEDWLVLFRLHLAGSSSGGWNRPDAAAIPDSFETWN